MLADQALKMISGMVVFFYLAKYLGPERFGQLNYTIAFVFIFYPVVQMGMFSILTRELIHNKGREQEYLNTAFTMCLLSALLMFAVCNTVNFYFNSGDSLVVKLIFIYSFSLLFKPFEVINYYFQSQHKAKFSAIARSIAIFITVVAKLLLVYFAADLELIMYSFLLESVLIFVFLSGTKYLISNSFLRFQFVLEIVKEYSKSTLPMIFSALTVAIYSRMDQIMIKKLLNNTDLGVYSSAIKLYEGVSTIIFTITVSLLPALIHLKASNNDKFEAMFAKAQAYLFWGCIFLATIVTFFGKYILNILYGEEYLGASQTLSICFFSLAFSSMGSLMARYFTITKSENKLLIRTLITLVINFILNIIFIKLMGKEGAAIATLITLFIGNYILDYFDKDLKPILKVKNKALLFRL